jgi:hypothetical protein
VLFYDYWLWKLTHWASSDNRVLLYIVLGNFADFYSCNADLDLLPTNRVTPTPTISMKRGYTSHTALPIARIVGKTGKFC